VRSCRRSWSLPLFKRGVHSLPRPGGCNRVIQLSDKHIAVTGGEGFLGRYVVQALRARGCTCVTVPSITQYDLTKEEAVARFYADARPEIVIHLAAEVGGIGANRANPGRFAYANLVMGALLIEYARIAGIEKFVQIGTICAYPKFAPVPFQEADIWNGYPEETNAPYGLAKKMLLVLAQAYRQQYGSNIIYLLPVNLYGPYDNFNPESSHVIPALIRKCIEAKDLGSGEIICWGDGSATREFLYVEDCAEAIVLATERYDGSEPVNIGAGFEISIRDLVALIVQLEGFDGKVTWDTSKPNGQPRRRLDTTRAAKLFGFRAQTDFRTGLRKTIDWYRENRRGA
jgi:GDP-L-fucose synthase